MSLLLPADAGLDLICGRPVGELPFHQYSAGIRLVQYRFPGMDGGMNAAAPVHGRPRDFALAVSGTETEEHKHQRDANESCTASGHELFRALELCLCERKEAVFTKSDNLLPLDTPAYPGGSPEESNAVCSGLQSWESRRRLSAHYGGL